MQKKLFFVCPVDLRTNMLLGKVSFHSAVSDYLHTHSPLPQTKGGICEFLCRASHAPADVSAQTGTCQPDDAFHCVFTQSFQDLGWSQVRAAAGFHQICAPCFVDGPRAPSTIWCTPAQTHPLWWICMQVESLNFQAHAAKTPERSSVSQWGRLSVDKERHPSPAERSSYFRAVVLGHVSVSRKVETCVSSERWVDVSTRRRRKDVF